MWTGHWAEHSATVKSHQASELSEKPGNYCAPSSGDHHSMAGSSQCSTHDDHQRAGRNNSKCPVLGSVSKSNLLMYPIGIVFITASCSSHQNVYINYFNVWNIAPPKCRSTFCTLPSEKCYILGRSYNYMVSQKGYYTIPYYCPYLRRTALTKLVISLPYLSVNLQQIGAK